MRARIINAVAGMLLVLLCAVLSISLDTAPTLEKPLKKPVDLKDLRISYIAGPDPHEKEYLQVLLEHNHAIFSPEGGELIVSTYFTADESGVQTRITAYVSYKFRGRSFSTSAQLKSSSVLAHSEQISHALDAVIVKKICEEYSKKYPPPPPR